MGTVAQREIKDAITTRLHAAFPDSPEFAAFLREEMRYVGASYEFADILCQTLNAFFPSARPVPVERVRHLSVMGDLNAIGKMNRAFGMNMAIANSITFGLRLAGKIIVSPTTNEHEQVPYRSIDLSDKQIEDFYIQLFFCAQAMLASVEIDLNADIAA